MPVPPEPPAVDVTDLVREFAVRKKPAIRALAGVSLTVPRGEVHGLFTMVLRHGGRVDLSAYAVVAPFFMSLWWFAIFNGGWVIQTERWEGTPAKLTGAATR